MSRQYNDPAGGVESSVGNQMNIFKWSRKSLIELQKERFFTQLGGSENLPKHFGKAIKKYHYLPLLDNRNINDQGIDAAGVTIDSTKFYLDVQPSKQFTVEADATAAAAALNAVQTGVASKSGSASPWTVTTTVTRFKNVAESLANNVANTYGGVLTRGSGNLYGSSKDVGTITDKMPVLSETGGRVNRVGFKRVEIEGTIEKFGFFQEYTQESVDFDSDDKLMEHIYREMLRGAQEINEDAVQLDLLNAAGVVKFAGSAMDDEDIDGTSEVTYGDLLRLSIDLDNNRTPKQTKIVTGTRNIDTKTIAGGRIMFVGSELQPLLDKLVDSHGERAFVPVHKYAAGTDTVNGEIGSIGFFRIVVVPEMKRWAGAGADAGNDTTHYQTDGKFDVFPMLVVGSESFSTIGFQHDGKTNKFTIINKKPGEGMASLNDPFGEKGFSSIKWYYGTLIERAERIALIKTAAIL